MCKLANKQMDALNLPDNYTYESQQGEDEIRVYIKEVTDEESALVCLEHFSVNVSIRPRRRKITACAIFRPSVAMG